MNTYIKKGQFYEFDFELDSNYLQGTSYEDSVNDKWVKLTESQVAFRVANPTASNKEVFDMTLNVITPSETDLLNAAIRSKLTEIENQDNYSNKFYVSVLHYKKDSNGVILTDESGNKLTEEIANVELWTDKDLRNSLLNITLPSLKANGETWTKLWSTTTPPQSLNVPIDWAIEKLPLVELYAKKTYDFKQSNIALTYSKTTVEDVNAINVLKNGTDNFPSFLTFKLNLDLYA